MAEPTTSTMADYLQGRARAPYVPAMSEFTSPRDLQRERLSNVFGWDVGRPGEEFARRARTLIQLPLAMRAGGMPAGMPARPAPAPSGPWQPGYLESWLQGRYQPTARPQAWQPDKRWG